MSKRAVAAMSLVCAACSGSISDKALLVAPGAASLRAGATLQLSALLVKSDGSTKDVTAAGGWRSSDESVATVSAAGVVTGVAAGQANIGLASGSLSASAAITVGGPGLRAVSIVAAHASVPKGYSQPLAAVGIYDDGTTRDLTASVGWVSSDISLATADGGLFIAKSAGKVTVTATAQGVSGSAELTVSNAALTSIAVTPATLSIAAGLSRALVVTGTFDDGTTLDVTPRALWSSAAIADVSLAGMVVGLAPGSGTLTATVDGKSGSVAVTVTAAQLLAVAVTGASGDLVPPGTRQLAATGAYSDGSTQDLTASATWSSDAAGVATVAGGLVSGVAAGDATIGASSGGISGTAVVHVRAATLQSLSISPHALTLAAGERYALTASGVSTAGNAIDVGGSLVWTSEAGSVAAIDASGLVVALHDGTTTVTASAEGRSASILVTVVAAPLVAIDVTPGGGTLPLGLAQQYAATGVFGDGTTADLTAQVAWSTGCADSEAASVTAGGVFTGTSPYTSCDVSAHDAASGMDGTTSVYIAPPVAVSYFVEPASATLHVGDTLQIAAFARMSDGSVVDQIPFFPWSTEDGAVATVDAGLVTAVAKGGPVNIHFGSSDPGPAAAITVIDPVLTALSVAPQTGSVGAGKTLQLAALGAFSDGGHVDLTGAVTWSGGDSHLSVDASGLVHGLALGGPATVTATHAASGLVATAQISVTGPALVAIAVSPPHPALLQHGTLQLTATGLFSDDTSAPLSGLTWSTSADSSYGTVDSNGLFTAGAVVGTLTVYARDPATDIAGHAMVTVNGAGAPRLTGAPSFSADPQAAGTMTVTLPITPNVYRAWVIISDFANDSFSTTNPSFTVVASPGQATLDVPVQLGCFGAAKVYAQVQVQDVSGGYSTYSFNEDQTEYAIYQQYNDGTFHSTSGYAPVPIRTTAIGPAPEGACHFPSLLAQPTFGADPATGGGTVDVNVSVSSDVRNLYVELHDLATGARLGDGSLALTGSETMPVTVPVAPTSCYSNATHAYVEVVAEDSAGDGADYFEDASVSTGAYVLQQYNHDGTGPEVLQSMPLATAGWQKGGSCSGVPMMTGQPTIDKTTVASGGTVTVTFPVNAATVTGIVVMYSETNGAASGSAYATINAGVATATFPMSEAVAGQTYYANIRTYTSTSQQVGSNYERQTSITGTDYSGVSTDAFGFNDSWQDTGWTLLTVTVTPGS